MVCKGTVINRGVGGQLLHWSDPPNNFWWLSWSPHVFIFQANLSGPPSESFNSFQWSPTFGVLSYDWSPQKNPPPTAPPRQAINNDRSLKRLWMPAEKVLYKLFLLSSLLLLLCGVWIYSFVTPASWVMFTIIPSRGKSTTHSCVIQQKQGCLRLSEPLLPTPSVIFDHRLRIVIFIIIGPFRFLSLLRMCNEIHENRHGSWQKHSPPCILIPTLYRANQKLRLGNQSIVVLVI